MVKEHIMTYHEFDNSLSYEHSGFEKQDEFYKGIFSNIGLDVTEIHRYDFSIPEEREKQRKDIDLCIKYKKNNGSISEITISEKRRKKDYGDLLFELYSSYEDNILGWSEKGEADYLAYFVMDKFVYLFREKELNDFYNRNNIKKQVEESGKIKELIEGNSSRIGLRIDIDGNSTPCSLTKAVNRNRNYSGTYTTISLCLNYDFIKGVKIKKIDYNTKKLL